MPSRKKTNEIFSEMRIFFKILAVVLCVFFACYFLFNTVSLARLERAVVNDYKSIYSISRRFSSYYNNVDSVSLEKGRYYKNGVDIVVNSDTNVKVLSIGIKKLRTELEKLIGDNLWTIAVFQNPSKYVHFDPLRKNYEMFYQEGNKDVIEDIVDKESLRATYQSFYGCNLKLTEKYKEDETHELIRSMFYPIYNKKHLDSLLVVDIKASLLYDKVTKFNKEYNTVINWQGSNTYQKSMYLPCSEQDEITLGIGFVDVFKEILIPSILFALSFFFLRVNYNRRKYLLQFDRMTGFYRRDFYEKRLKRMRTHALLIIDIDHFKRINDTYGHKKGDDVIQEIAERILGTIRRKDAAIRWGGEEFLITFKSLSYEQLEVKAENIRAAIEKELVKKLAITVSIGGVVDADMSFSEAYKLADSALYLSKENGRNRVTMAD
ncbi:GGDEF domain-containing protein [Aliivibrio sp. EL58]|uniref:GGDEF domain-containing protein n=1 Tax=Aliivibrio sp. EL58 TaxID=2107582 RepID=UPI000EFAA600|nr:GGDEF domain-containing protein [Aliivibrio sp. EL58]